MPFLLAGFGEFSWQDSAGSLRIKSPMSDMRLSCRVIANSNADLYSGLNQTEFVS